MQEKYHENDLGTIIACPEQQNAQYLGKIQEKLEYFKQKIEYSKAFPLKLECDFYNVFDMALWVEGSKHCFCHIKNQYDLEEFIVKLHQRNHFIVLKYKKLIIQMLNKITEYLQQIEEILQILEGKTNEKHKEIKKQFKDIHLTFFQQKVKYQTKNSNYFDSIAVELLDQYVSHYRHYYSRWETKGRKCENYVHFDIQTIFWVYKECNNQVLGNGHNFQVFEDTLESQGKETIKAYEKKIEEIKNQQANP